MNHKLSPNFAIILLVLIGAIFAAAYWLYNASINEIPIDGVSSSNQQMPKGDEEQEQTADPEEQAIMQEESDIENSLSDGGDFEEEMAEIEESMEFEDVDFSDITF